jgi:tRNA threonylcarbamoyladenosine biosynthesis protein TsaE
MDTFISHSAEETLALGEAWGRAAATGLVIALSGDLGAGKTQLARGVARGLGVSDRVHSPTFTLVNEYGGGRLPLFHIDLYRLESPEQIVTAGLEEYFHPAGVSVVEWAERWFDEAAGTKSIAGGIRRPGSIFRQVRIEVVNENERRIIYEDSGA